MNRLRMAELLQSAGVPASWYSLDESWREYGFRIWRSRHTGRWLVQYMERGEATLLGEFETEEEACEGMYRLILESR